MSPRLPLRRTARPRCREWGRTLRLWDLASGREIETFEGHSEYVYSVAIAPDGRTALSGSWRQHCKALGSGQWPRDQKIRGAFGLGHVGCLFAGRQDRALGRRGQHAETLGSGQRARDRKIRGAFGAGSTRCHFAGRQDRALGQLRQTLRSGIWPAAARSKNL